MPTVNKNFKVKNGLDVNGAISATSTISASGLAGSLLTSTSPSANGTASAGTSTVPARADHVHPTDTTRAPLASPTFTGTPAAPTAASGTNSTQVATTAYVKSLFGAGGTTGTLDWNDVSNTRPGVGPTLLMGNATNGPGPANYFHVLNIEYSTKDGTGNVTQLAIPYGSVSADLWMRGRYGGVWTSWGRFWAQTNDGSGSGLDADLLDGYNTATAGTANTIALRDSNGDLTARYNLGQYTAMTHSAATRATDTVFYSSTDNYIRKNTADGFKKSLNVEDIHPFLLSCI